METTSHTVQTSTLEGRNGSLSGHSLECSCGLRWTTSLSLSLAQGEANTHLEWHTRSGR